MASSATGAVRVISNGCDFDDFAGLEYVPGERFRITHTGSFFGKRDPRPFLQAFRDADLDAVARFVGDFRSTDREWAESAAASAIASSSCPMRRARSRSGCSATPRRCSYSCRTPADAARASSPGKVYEYIAAGRPILAVVPPDGAAAELVRETGAGVVVAPDDVEGIRDALVEHARAIRERRPCLRRARQARRGPALAASASRGAGRARRGARVTSHALPVPRRLDRASASSSSRSSTGSSC